jgi:hypothetical protein
LFAGDSSWKARFGTFQDDPGSSLHCSSIQRTSGDLSKKMIEEFAEGKHFRSERSASAGKVPVGLET